MHADGKAWLVELLGSLRRAGLEFHDEVGFVEDEGGGAAEVTLRLKAPVAPGGAVPLGAFVRGSALEKGYRAAVHYRRRPGHLAIILSRAESKAS